LVSISKAVKIKEASIRIFKIEVDKNMESIELISDRELEKMRRSGRIAVDLLAYLAPMVQSGVSTLEINNAAETWIQTRGAKSAMLRHNGYPKSICTSVNEAVCNAIPTATQILKQGNIINITVALVVDNYYGKTSRTFYVGQISPAARRLVEVAAECLRRGIAAVGPEAKLGDIGAAIQEYAELCGFSVVRDYVGHGIGRVFHAPPQIPHHGIRGKGKKLRPGMVFTIQPMINKGSWEVEVLPDQWTAVTKDRKLSAQFEHMVAVTNNGVEILTLSNYSEVADTSIDASLDLEAEQDYQSEATAVTLQASPLSPADQGRYSQESLENSIEAHYRSGTAFLEQGHYREALMVYDAALQLAPEVAEAHQGRAVALYRLGQLTEALEACEAALRLRPDFAEAHHIRAGVLFAQGKLQDALICCDTAIRLCPTAPAAYHLKAGILKEQGRWQASMQSCEQALQLNPDFLLAYELRSQLQLFLQYEAGLNLISAREYPAALELFKNLTQALPEFAEAFYGQGLALANLGRHAEALVAFEAALRLNPTFDEVYRNRDSALYNLGRTEVALESYRTLLASVPNYAYGYYRQGILLDALGHYEAALAALNRSIQLEPNFGSAQLSKGIVLDRLGRTAEALQALNESLRLDPSSPQAQNSWHIVMRKLGR
jgi:methionyl aminopeptidase